MIQLWISTRANLKAALPQGMLEVVDKVWISAGLKDEELSAERDYGLRVQTEYSEQVCIALRIWSWGIKCWLFSFF